MKNSTRQALGVLVVALASALGTAAQQVEVYMGGGLHGLQYSPSRGSSTLGCGGTLGGAYAHPLGGYWGLGAGLSLSSSRSEAQYSFMEAQAAYDAYRGEGYEFRTYYNGYTESQGLLQLGIPVQATVDAPLSARWGISGALGVMLQVPIRCSFRLESGTRETRGYYPSTNVEYADLPQHGFTTTGASGSGTWNGKISVALVSDAGATLRMADDRRLYMGLYLAYGLTPTAEGTSLPLLNPTGEYNGTLGSDQVDGAHSLSVGLKVGLRLGLKRRRANEQPVPPVPSEQPEHPDTVGQAARVEAERLAMARAQAELERQAAAARAEAERQAAAERVRMDAEELKQREAEAARAAELRGRMERSASSINQTVRFPEAGSAVVLAPQSELAVDTLAAIARENPDIHLYVVGHTNDAGSEGYNLQLGQRRAEAFRQELLKRGVRESQVSTSSMGETYPLVPNTTADSRAQNRRIEVEVKQGR